YSTPSTKLNDLCASAVKSAVAQSPQDKIKDEDIAVTMIDLHDPAHLTIGSSRGDQGIFPASVVKLFYLVATHQWMQDGKLQDSDELRRAMKDMIVESNNDATNSLLEALTDAQNGAILEDAQMKQWSEKRNAVNRYF